MNDVEYIFVDDASLDNSIQILREIVNKNQSKKNSVKIISHDINRGLPSARNSGLDVAVGEYVIFCDSDDWVECDMCEELYNKIDQTDSDIVWADYYVSTKNTDKVIKQNGKDSHKKIIYNLLATGTINWCVWNKIIRRDLFVRHNIKFNDNNNMGEDMGTVSRLFLIANKFDYVNKPFYHYFINNTSITKTSFSNKKYDELLNNANLVNSFYTNVGVSLIYKKELYCLQLRANLYCVNSRASIDTFKIWNRNNTTPLLYMFRCPCFSLGLKFYLFLISMRFYCLGLLMAKFRQ